MKRLEMPEDTAAGTRYRVSMRHASADLVVDDGGRVVEAAPVLRRYRGWLWRDVQRELGRRGADVRLAGTGRA